jgi:hypothetical protein
MTTQELLTIKLELNNKSTIASQALTDYCAPFRGAMGLVSDECHEQESYKAYKKAYAIAHNNLRAFNKATSKNKELQKAIKENIMQRRMAKA